MRLDFSSRKCVCPCVAAAKTAESGATPSLARVYFFHADSAKVSPQVVAPVGVGIVTHGFGAIGSNMVCTHRFRTAQRCRVMDHETSPAGLDRPAVAGLVGSGLGSHVAAGAHHARSLPSYLPPGSFSRRACPPLRSRPTASRSIAASRGTRSGGLSPVGTSPGSTRCWFGVARRWA